MRGQAAPEHCVLEHDAHALPCLAHSRSHWQGLLCQCFSTSSCEVTGKALEPQKSAWPPASVCVPARWKPWGYGDGLRDWQDSTLEAAVWDQLQRQACSLSSRRNPMSVPQATPSGDRSHSWAGCLESLPCRACVCPRSQAPARLAKCWVIGSRCWRRTRSSLDASETPPAQASQGRRPNPTV